MKKYFSLLFIFLLALVLFACKPDDSTNGGNNGNDDNNDVDNGDNNDNDDDENPIQLTPEERLGKSLELFGDKNYQINIKIMREEVEEANITLKVDNNKSHYYETNSVEEYYERDNRNLTIYVKNFDEWTITTGRQPIDENYQIYNKFAMNWFDYENNTFTLKETNLADFWSLFNYPEDFIIVSSSLVISESNQLESLNIMFTNDEVNYEIIQTFTNWNETTVTLPEVS